jgi:hypothetical protein
MYKFCDEYLIPDATTNDFGVLEPSNYEWGMAAHETHKASIKLSLSR